MATQSKYEVSFQDVCERHQLLNLNGEIYHCTSMHPLGSMLCVLASETFESSGVVKTTDANTIRLTSESGVTICRLSPGEITYLVKTYPEKSEMIARMS